ncbi:MAG: hypothetical protein AAFQ98_14910, partial [Bacteroidota bacterium]
SGASTNLDGKYTIKRVPEAVTTLRFSSVGYYTLEAKVGSQAVMNVVMIEDPRAVTEYPFFSTYNTFFHISPGLIFGMPNQPWGGSIEIDWMPFNGMDQQTNQLNVFYRRQGGRANHNFEQAGVKIGGLFWEGQRSMSLNFLADRLEQGESNHSLTYRVGLDMYFSHKLPIFHLGIGGGKYGEFLRSDVHADYLLYDAGLSHSFRLFNNDLGVITELKATYWDPGPQNSNPMVSPTGLWGWEGSLTLGYDGWSVFVEHRRLAEQKLTSIGLAYELSYRW